MSETVKLKLEGFESLEKKLRELGPKVEQNGLRYANFRGAMVLVRAAQAIVPVRTGLLKKDIVTFRRPSPKGIAKLAVGVRGFVRRYAKTSHNRRMRRVGKPYRVDGPAYYGKFLEFGTSRMQANPWLRPAFYGNIFNIIEAIRDGLYSFIVKASK